jgi:3-hydroxybutyryl-CoA dehydrogenase
MATIAANLDRMISKGVITEEDKTITNIITYTDIKDGVVGVDLVVEAATENIDLKLSIFKQLSEACSPDTILSTNTSSISITQIGAVVSNPERVIGMHFMNPVPIMKLVEIIRGYSTSDEVTKTIMTLSEKLGKTPVEVNDYPGFVANRILMPMINETLYNKVAGVYD